MVLFNPNNSESNEVTPELLTKMIQSVCMYGFYIKAVDHRIIQLPKPIHAFVYHSSVRINYAGSTTTFSKNSHFILSKL